MKKAGRRGARLLGRGLPGVLLGLGCLGGMAHAAPGPSLDELASAIGVPAISLEKGEAGHVTWDKAERLINGDVLFTEMKIAKKGQEARFLRVLLTGGGIQAEIARLRGSDKDSRSSVPGVRRMALSGPDVHAAFFGKDPVCIEPPSGAAEAAAGAEALLANSVEFSELSLATPDMPASDEEVLGRPAEMASPGEETRGPERFAAASGTVGFAISPETGCVTVGRAQIAGLSALSAAGDALLVSGLAYEAKGGLGHDLNVNGISVADEAGNPVLALSQGVFSYEVTPEFLSAVPKDASLFSNGLAGALGTGASLDLKMSGLSIKSGFMDHQGVQSPDLDGDVSLKLSSTKDGLNLVHKSDLKNLAALDLEAELAVSEQTTGMAAMISSFKKDAGSLEALGRLSIVSGRFSYRDDGLADLTRKTTGMAPSELLQISSVLASKAPASLVEPVLDWLGRAVDTQGEARIKPKAPVNLTDLGLVAALNPGALPEQLGLTLKGAEPVSE